MFSPVPGFDDIRFYRIYMLCCMIGLMSIFATFKICAPSNLLCHSVINHKQRQPSFDRWINHV